MSEAVGLILQQFINNCMSGVILREYDISRINDILDFTLILDTRLREYDGVVCGYDGSWYEEFCSCFTGYWHAPV